MIQFVFWNCCIYSVMSIWNFWNRNGFRVFHFTSPFLPYIYMLIISNFYLFVYHNTSYQKHIVNHANIATKMCLLRILINYVSFMCAVFCNWICTFMFLSHLSTFFDLTLIINGCFVPLSFCPFLSAYCRVLCFFCFCY